MKKKIFILGGAGFIGQNLTEKLLKNKNNQIIIFDNLSSKVNYKNLEKLKKNKNVNFVKKDAKSLKDIVKFTKKTNIVYHLAANPDISLSAEKPEIDFWQGTYITNNLLEAIRKNRIKNLIYTSGSGVYGDSNHNFKESHGPCHPISTYASSKIACEAMISSYAHMYNFKARVLRFANVVGRFQTHGVVYDFIKKLRRNQMLLKVLGNGKQIKSYIHIEDVLDAIDLVSSNLSKKKLFDVFNVSNNDRINVRNIANIVTKQIINKKIKIIYGKSKIGWNGDVSRIKMNSNKIKKIGWKFKHNSKEAILKSCIELSKEI